MTLTEFLLARIAEDEAAAQGATIEPVGTGRSWFDGWSDTHPVGIHIGKWAPTRVLAECEAKRRIVAKARVWLDDDPDGTSTEAMARACWTEALQPLAVVYADHPDYREEWRP